MDTLLTRGDYHAQPPKQSFMNQHRRTITQVNAFKFEQFMNAFGSVFEHSPWVAEQTWSKLPFASVDALHRALCETLAQSSDEKQLALIRAHPDLVGRAAVAATLTPASHREQAGAGLDSLRPQDVAAFQSLNQRYHDQFGFPFIICARLNTKDAILAAFPVRLKNNRDEEIRTALTEIYKIARLRLLDLVKDSGPPAS